MPGGSVNGRPFREGQDAYSKTGIPCGNPKRFQSRDVIKMGVQNQNALSKPLVGPLEDIETESDRQLQNLLQKQLNTNITIQEQFKQHKRFSDGVSHLSSTDTLSGSVSLEEYRDLSHLDAYIVELKHCGLTQDEIELKLEDMGHSKSKKLRLNLEPGVRENKLLTIERKIVAKKKQLEQADLFAGAKKMSRHEMDLERAISQNNERTKLLGCLLTTSRGIQELTNSDDPMDHLPEILNIVTKRARTKARHRKRQSEITDNAVCEDDSTRTDLKSSTVEVEDTFEEIGKGSDRTPSSCENKNTSESRADKGPCASEGESSNLRSLSGKIDSIPEEEIITNRLTVTEIQQLPRFKNYTAGEPSQVLYVKNLPGKTCEEDLIRLFIRFQTAEGPQIVFKLMKGRMKGQAFITFDSVATATEALHLVNGFIFHGKPVIIQYGKKLPIDS